MAAPQADGEEAARGRGQDPDGDVGLEENGGVSIVAVELGIHYRRGGIFTLPMLARMPTAATVTVAAAGAGGGRAAREFTGPGMKSNLFRRVQPHGEPGLGRHLLNEKSGDGSGDGSMGVSWRH